MTRLLYTALMLATIAGCAEAEWNTRLRYAWQATVMPLDERYSITIDASDIVIPPPYVSERTRTCIMHRHQCVSEKAWK